MQASASKLECPDEFGPKRAHFAIYIGSGLILTALYRS